MEPKLASGKKMYLSKDSRVTLIKITLCKDVSIIISTFHHNGSTHGETSTKFLVEGMNEEFRFHLVKWVMVCSSILEGGLENWYLSSLTKYCLAYGFEDITTDK